MMNVLQSNIRIINSFFWVTTLKKTQVLGKYVKEYGVSWQRLLRFTGRQNAPSQCSKVLVAILMIMMTATTIVLTQWSPLTHINMWCISHLNTIKAINCNFFLSLEKLLCLYLYKVILVISTVKKHECSEAKNIFQFSITESATHDKLVWISNKTSLVDAAQGRSCSRPIMTFWLSFSSKWQKYVLLMTYWLMFILCISLSGHCYYNSVQ